MAITLITLEIAPGEKKTLIPSIRSKANNTCDVVTDVVMIAPPLLESAALSFYSSVECDAKSALGFVLFEDSTNIVTPEKVNRIFERHDLHIPVFGQDEDKKIYVKLTALYDVTLRIGVQS